MPGGEPESLALPLVVVTGGGDGIDQAVGAAVHQHQHARGQLGTVEICLLGAGPAGGPQFPDKPWLLPVMAAYAMGASNPIDGDIQIKVLRQ